MPAKAQPLRKADLIQVQISSEAGLEDIHDSGTLKCVLGSPDHQLQISKCSETLMSNFCLKFG